MRQSSSSISACRHCQYYSPQGRRGGHCKKLNVSVKSHWTACNFATPPFAATWKELESITAWTQKTLLKEDIVLAVETSLNPSLFEEGSSSSVSAGAGVSPSAWM